MSVQQRVVVVFCSFFLLCCLTIGTGFAQTAATASVPEASQAVGQVLDINQADLDSLASLPGIGPKLAERIQVYREENGPFKSVDDLLKVKGVGPKMLEKIKPLITVS